MHQLHANTQELHEIHLPLLPDHLQAAVGLTYKTLGLLTAIDCKKHLPSWAHCHMASFTTLVTGVMPFVPTIHLICSLLIFLSIHSFTCPFLP